MLLLFLLQRIFSLKSTNLQLNHPTFNEKSYKNTLQLTIGFDGSKTEDLWMLVMYKDKTANEDAAVLAAVHSAAEEVYKDSLRCS